MFLYLKKSPITKKTSFNFYVFCFEYWIITIETKLYFSLHFDAVSLFLDRHPRWKWKLHHQMAYPCLKHISEWIYLSCTLINSNLLLAQITISPSPSLMTNLLTWWPIWPRNDVHVINLNRRQFFPSHNIHVYTISIPNCDIILGKWG